MLLKKVTRVFYSIIAVIIVALTTTLFSLSNSDIEDVVVCSMNNDAHLIPSDVCEYYLQNHRVNPDDIQYLEEGAGLSFLLGIPNQEKRYKLMEHFISKGVSLNKPSAIDGLPPLHAAIVSDDQRAVSLLLKRGASLTQEDEQLGLTPVEFTKYLMTTKNFDREKILNVLLSRC